MSLTLTQGDEEFIKNAILAKDKKGYTCLSDVFSDLVEASEGFVDVGEGWSIYFDWTNYYTFRCLNKKLVGVYKNGLDICPIAKCKWIAGRPGKCEHLASHFLSVVATPDKVVTKPATSIIRPFKNNTYNTEGDFRNSFSCFPHFY